MTSPELENLVRIGKLKREPPSRREFHGLLHSGAATAQTTGISSSRRSCTRRGFPPRPRGCSPSATRGVTWLSTRACSRWTNVWSPISSLPRRLCSMPCAPSHRRQPSETRTGRGPIIDAPARGGKSAIARPASAPGSGTGTARPGQSAPRGSPAARCGRPAARQSCRRCEWLKDDGR